MPALAPHHDRYSVDKTAVGGVTFVTLRGTLNEDFEGRKLASSFRTRKVVIEMRDVRRFASWGMSEWMDLLRECGNDDLYLVECSTYAVSQLMLITGLLGQAKLVSFYASYRCAGCSEELQNLFLIPRDRAAIREMRGSTESCPTCGGTAQIEAYSAAFFDAIANRPTFDIDDEVLSFMRTRFNYDLSADLTRFRAFRRTHKGYTYIRLSGNIATLRPDVLASEGTTVVDLAQVVFDPDQLGAWRDYLKSATTRVKSLQLENCPPGFLEHAVRSDDLRERVKIRTFTASYECVTCGTRSLHLVDVAKNLEELVQGALPTARCRQCQATIEATPSNELKLMVSSLPARDHDTALDTFISKSQSEPIDNLENCFDQKKPTQAVAPSSRRLRYAIIPLSVVAVVGLAVGVTRLLNGANKDPIAGTTGSAQAVIPPPPTFTRPDWIVSDIPSSGHCQDMINRLMCVGVSAFRDNRDEGLVEASDVALEELVNAVALKITDANFKDTIMPMYSQVRSKFLSELQAADLNRKNKTASNAFAGVVIDENVRKTRKRVVDVLRGSGGTAVPAQRSDWYWEEYTTENGTGTEFLVFIRYDISIDAMRTLVEKYSATTTVLGSSLTTAFPALAWSHASFNGGALFTNVHKPFADAGIGPQQIVVAVADQRVTDAAGFAKAIDATSGDLKLTTILVGDAPAKVVTVKPPK